MDSHCYVYAILGRQARIPTELIGMNDAPLAAVSSQELTAAVSPIAAARLPPTPTCLLRHENVVEALCQVGPALPVRFGTILDDPEAVAQALAGKYEVLRADLARVGGKVELGLTILWGPTDGATEVVNAPPPQPSALPSHPCGPGTRYMQARLAQYQQEAARQRTVRALVAEVEHALRTPTLEQRYRLLPISRPVVRAAYLVQPECAPDCEKIIDGLRQAHPDLRWLLSGPWPPYSFVSGAGKPFQQSNGLKLDKESI